MVCAVIILIMYIVVWCWNESLISQLGLFPPVMETHMKVEEILLSPFVPLYCRAVDKCEKSCRWNSLSLITFNLGPGVAEK